MCRLYAPGNFTSGGGGEGPSPQKKGRGGGLGSVGLARKLKKGNTGFF